MVDKKVGFNIVIGGIPQIRSSLKGVTESAKAMNLSIQQLGERTAQRLIEIERNKLSVIKKINDSQVGNEESKARKILEVESRLARQITSIKERETLRIKHMNEQFVQNDKSGIAQRFNISALGHGAQAAGFYRTGHMIRMASQMGIGSEMGGKGGVGGTGLALGELAA